MPKEFSRTQRIAELIQHTLANILMQEVDDPRLRLVTITKVTVSPDLSHARVLITQLDDKQPIEQTLQQLNKIAGFLRYRLAHTIEIRVMPQLKFFYDASIRESAHLSSLIDRAVEQDQRKHKKDEK